MYVLQQSQSFNLMDTLLVKKAHCALLWQQLHWQTTSSPALKQLTQLVLRSKQQELVTVSHRRLKKHEPYQLNILLERCEVSTFCFSRIITWAEA